MNIETEALLVIQKYAAEHHLSLGEATSDLVVRGAQGGPQFKMKNGWAMIDVPASSHPITNETLDQAEEADYDEEFRRALSPRR